MKQKDSTIFSSSDKSEIAQRAQFFSERFEAVCRTRGLIEILPEHERKIASRLAHWKQVAAEGNEQMFERRLKWDGYDFRTVRRVLGEVESAPRKKRVLPAWTRMLEEIGATAVSIFETQETTREAKKKSKKKDEIAFQGIFAPFLEVARQRLDARIAPKNLSPDAFHDSLFASDAFRPLEKMLYERLLFIASQTITVELLEFHGFDARSIDPKKNLDLSRYNDFVSSLLKDGFRKFFLKYPVLARFVTETIGAWVDATLEFKGRFEKDSAAIRKFLHTRNHDLVHSVVAASSDSHHRGKMVLVITFNSRKKLVYKPKPQGIEHAYAQFLEWCNKHGSPVKLVGVRVLDRGTYGWAEYIAHEPCADKKSVKRFYRRLGAQLCVLYVLGGTDCHAENIIARGEYPSLIDAETMLNSATVSFMSSRADTPFDSIIRTSMLPHRRCFMESHIANEGLPVIDVDGKGSVHTHLPLLAGKAVTARKHLPGVEHGFTLMYRFFLAHRHELLGPKTPLHVFQDLTLRSIFRQTSLYARILKQSMRPTFLRNGIDWSIEIDYVSRVFLFFPDKPSVWPMLSAERKAFEHLDIPFFSSDTSRLWLKGEAGTRVERFFQISGYQKVFDRLAQMSELDLAKSIEIFSATFAFRKRKSHAATLERILSGAPSKRPQKLVVKDKDYSKVCLSAARMIAETVRERAMVGSAGDVNWLGMILGRDRQHLEINLLGNGLYDGRCGVALFLSAFFRITHLPEYRELALGSLQHLIQMQRGEVSWIEKQNLEQSGIGGASGIGSILYTLVKMGDLLDEPSLLDTAGVLAKLITPETISRDTHYDVIHGSAGALLGFLALYRVKKDPAVLENARLCAEHLLAERAKVNKHLTWKGAPKYRAATRAVHCNNPFS